MGYLANMSPEEHAAKILEERNAAYRILYNTVMEVEGASDELTYRILCSNLLKICNASFAALAVFDNDTSELTLEAVECSEYKDFPPCRDFHPLTQILNPENIEYLKTIQVRICNEHKMCVASFFHDFIDGYIERIDGKCYQMSCVRGGVLVAAGMVICGQKLRMKDIVDTYLNLAGIIIERSSSTAKLRESRENFRNLVTNINDIIYLRDPDGTVTYINDAAREILGYEPPELVNNSLFYDIICNNPNNRRAVEIIREELKGVQPEKSYECEVITKSGNMIILDIRDKLIIDNDQVLRIQGICRDVTSRKKTEKLLIEKNRELNEFTKIVSHDLKAPIGVMKSFLANIKEDPSLFDIFADQLTGQADRLLAFIDSLLKLCKAGMIVSEKTEINLKHLMTTCLTNLKPPDLKVDIVIADDLPCVYADYLAISQVFSNLVSNSIRYRDPEKDSLVIGIDIIQGYGFTEIKYNDNGLGIAREYLPKIFSSGFTAGKKAGTGFGLAIVKKIIEAHNGEIGVDSEGEGKGVVFSIKIPSDKPSCPLYMKAGQS